MNPLLDFLKQLLDTEKTNPGTLADFSLLIFAVAIVAVCIVLGMYLFYRNRHRQRVAQIAGQDEQKNRELVKLLVDQLVAPLIEINAESSRQMAGLTDQIRRTNELEAERIAMHKEELQRTHDAITETGERITALSTEVAGFDKKLADSAAATVDATNTRLAAHLDQMNTQQVRLNQQIAASEERLKEQIGAVTAKIVEVIAELSAARADLKGYVAGHAGSTDKLATELNDMNTKLSAILSDLSELKVKPPPPEAPIVQAVGLPAKAETTPVPPEPPSI
jgi:septal ring factor EnvC (AmiA/AmiB activator)